MPSPAASVQSKAWHPALSFAVQAYPFTSRNGVWEMRTDSKDKKIISDSANVVRNKMQVSANNQTICSPKCDSSTCIIAKKRVPNAP